MKFVVDLEFAELGWAFDRKVVPGLVAALVVVSAGIGLVAARLAEGV